MWLSCPISRARCRRGRRSSCSTSALLDTDRRDSSTRHTWGFPWEGHSDLASLTRQKKVSTHSCLYIYHVCICIYISNLCMVQCTNVHIHCGSTSHHWGNHCHWSRIQHRLRSPSSCEDTLLAWLKGKQTLTYTKRTKTWILKDFLSTLDFPVKFSHWEDSTKDLKARKKFNIVARTESRRDTDSSTVKDTAFVVSGTVFITRTPLMWWDNIKETWAVAWFWENRWEKEAVKQKRRWDQLWKPNNLVVEWNSQTFTLF